MPKASKGTASRVEDMGVMEGRYEELGGCRGDGEPQRRAHAPEKLGLERDFVGRSRELGVLERALGDARSGRRRAVLISGEPGIGKTRLAGELASRAAAVGVRSHWGRCHEGEGAPAF